MTKAPKRSTSPLSNAANRAGERPHLPAVFVLILTATFVVYFPCLRGGFLWDDAGHVTNPELQSWSGLLRIWFEPGVTQQYYPLLHSAFWLEHRLWGDATPGYHLVNVLWHATAACLLVALLRRLAVPGALLAGLLFALHPVCVESVAWISEQKNTLSTVFYLAAALAWVRFSSESESEEESGARMLSERKRGATAAPLPHSLTPSPRHSPFHSRAKRAYAVATLWFLAALLTKTVTATLPAALLVLAWWRRGRLSWRDDMRPLLPWFVAGVGAGLFTAWFERTGIGAQGADFDLNLVERVLLAGRIVWFYLGKLLWPAELVFFYPRWEVDAAAVWQYFFPAAALALLGGLAWRAERYRGRGLLAAALLFGGTLFPVLGFVDVYPFVFSYVADHFQYLASLSLFAFAAASFVSAARRQCFGVSWHAGQAIAGGVLVALGAMSWAQSKHYVSSITLYRATLARNPDSWVAHHNLASELVGRGKPDLALPHARRAAELKPDAPEVLNNLADTLTRTGRAAESLPLLERAVQLQPRYAQAENTWGLALVSLDRRDEGVTHFQRAIALQPRLAEAHYNLGLAHADRGDFAAALPCFARTAQLRPEHAGAQLNWGLALALSNRLPEARPHFDRALQLDPESAALHQAYGRVLLNADQLDDAVRHLRDALQLDPALPGLHRDLAFALQRLGRNDEARRHAAEADRRP